MPDADLIQKLSSTGLGGVAVVAMLICLKMVSRISARPTREWMIVFGACCLLAILSVVAVLVQNQVLTTKTETLQTKVDDQRAVIGQVVEVLDQVASQPPAVVAYYTEEPETPADPPIPEAGPPEDPYTGRVLAYAPEPARPTPASSETEVELQEAVLRAKAAAEPFLAPAE